jgi:hypothetical protein
VQKGKDAEGIRGKRQEANGKRQGGKRQGLNLQKIRFNPPHPLHPIRYHIYLWVDKQLAEEID